MEGMDPQPGAAQPVPDPAPSASRVPLIAIGALIIFAIAVAIGIGTGGTAQFDAGTPQSVVQDYLEASLDGDVETAVALLVPRHRAACTEDIDDRFFGSSNVGFSLDEVTVEGDFATIVVNERRSNSDPFSSTRRVGDETFTLEQSLTGQWRIATATWPFNVRSCIEDNS